MNKTQLKKATITVLRGKSENPEISVLFNPNEYSLVRSNSYKATAHPGTSTPTLQFVNGESDTLSMDLFLDDYTDIHGPTSSVNRKEEQPVNSRLLAMTRLMDIDNELHAPPPIRFNWGPLEFTAILKTMTRKVTMFHPDGTPARATLSVTFQEYCPKAQKLAKHRNESTDKSKRRRVRSKDSLWAIAEREYGNPNEWIRIAEANDLDDPRDITPGNWLLVPKIEQTHESNSTI